MIRIVIFGNSGSGKSTLASHLATTNNLAHLDLDTIAWAKTETPTRLPLADSRAVIDQYLSSHKQWVIEGCYADLLGMVVPHATEIIFLNPGVDDCIDNCKNRPWEPHKYDSPEAQDKNLAMLIDWVKQYPQRTDEFSLQAHQQLFNDFNGNKSEHNANLTGLL